MIRRFDLIFACTLILTAGLSQPVYADGGALWERLLSGEDPGAVEIDARARVAEAPDDAVAQVVMALLLDRRLAGRGGEWAKSHAPQEGTSTAWRAWLDAARAYGVAPEAEAALLEAYAAALNAGEIAAFEKERSKIAKKFKRSAESWLLARHRFVETAVLQRQGKFRASADLAETMGFVTDWSYLAPFDNAEKRGHNQVFAPEEKLSFDGDVMGRIDRVAWRRIPVQSSIGFVNLYNLVRPAKESTSYLATTVTCEQATRAALHIGHAGAVKVWVNGVLVAAVERYHDPRPDQVSCVSSLRSGANLILAKVGVDEASVGGLFLRLINADTGRALAVDGSLAALRGVPKDRVQVLSGESPTFEVEPPAVARLFAAGPQRPTGHIAHVLYALLIQRLHTVDREDVTAYEMLSKVQEKYPDCALVTRLAAVADRQVNRKRVGLRHAVHQDPGDWRGRLQEIALARGRPFRERRREWIQQALDVSSDHPAFLAEYARLLREQSQIGPAMTYLYRAMEIDPKNPKVLMLAVELTDGQVGDAVRERWLERAIHAEHDAPNYYMHGLRMALARDDLSQAKRMLRAVSEADPWKLSGHAALARYHLAGADYEAASQAIQAGLAVSPDDAALHRLEAERLDATGAEPGAILEHLQAMLRAEPSEPWALDFIELISPDTDDYYAPYRKDWKELPDPPEALLKDANALVLLSQNVKRVHANGNSSATSHRVVKILNETAVRGYTTWPIYYESGRQDVRILTARVTQPDGSTIDAPAPRHQTVGGAGQAASRMYSDYNVAVLQIPGIQVGSVIEVEYQLEERGENIFADYFGDLDFVGDFDPTFNYEYVLITPKDREFYSTAIPASYPKDIVDTSLTSWNPEPTVETIGDERVYTWAATCLPRVPRDAGMPPVSEVLPYIKISTFKTWQDMTQWYWDLIKDQLRPDPEVRRQTEEVLAAYRRTKNMDAEAELSPADIVQAVNRFVNTEIRYLYHAFGVHGWKPHRVRDILQARYGDCKNKAALGLAMLGIAGVDANVVILRTSDRGEVDYELPSMGLFNHMIYYVPELGGNGLFIDGTAQYYGEMELPEMDSGVNALIVESGGASRFQRTPMIGADDNGAAYRTTLALDKTGSAKGHRRCDYVGLNNPLVRAVYFNRAKVKETIERQLVASFPGASCVDFDLSDLDTYGDNEWIAYNFDIPKFAVQEDERKLKLPTSLFLENFSYTYARSASRHYELVVGRSPWHKRNEVVIELPPGTKVVDLPEPVDLEGPFGRYKWTARVEGEKLTLEEEIAFAPRRVAVDEFQAFRDFCRRVDEAQERRLTVEVSS